MSKIAVLIPVYNEEKTIKKVIYDWQTNLPSASIYVYDNNSTDNTVAIVKNTGAYLGTEPKQGKGNVVRRMFREIDADCYIMVDGDDTYPVDSKIVSKVIDLVLNKNIDMVVGDRLSSAYYTENKRRFHNFGNSIVKKAVNTLFKSDVKDVMTGMRAFSKTFVKTFPILSEGFEIETEMTIHAADKNMAIRNITIPYKDRESGSESKLQTIPDGIKVIKTIIKLFKDYRPFAFFNTIALFFGGISIFAFIPILAEYFNTGLVSKVPTLIMCSLFMMIAIISFFSGLILNNIKRNERRSYEMMIQLIHKTR